jgi:hypothetical protein
MGFFALPLFSRPHPLNKITDIFFYLIIFLMLLIVITNCLHNIFLTKVYAAGGRLTTIKKTGFWILLILFTTIVLAFTYQFFISLSLRRRYTGAYRPYFNLRIFAQTLSISITGFYIIAMQVILFFSIKRSYRQELDNSIDELGS